MSTTRIWLAAQAGLFAGAALMHRGVFGAQHIHSRAATAESVIAGLLLLGLLGIIVVPLRTAVIALVVQVLAGIGTCIGIVMVAIGIGPHTPLDIALHAAMLVLIIAGIIHTRRRMTSRQA